MDFLTASAQGSRLRRLAPTVAAIAALVLAILASCLGAARSRPATFPHDVHVAQLNLACTMCHVTAKAALLPSMPPPELCAPCHEQKVEGQPSRDAHQEERTFAAWQEAWFEPGGRFRRASTGQLPDDVVFRHSDHAGQAQLDCASCHADVRSEHDVPAAMPDWKRACMDCHEQRGKDVADCRACHREIDRDSLPATHFHAWSQRHGDVVRLGLDDSQNRCELCHDQERSCTACHQNQPPQNHDSLFRTRTHGVLAAMDRSRCYTCHRTDSCEQCHSTTRPLSHRAGFGAPSQRHCNGCHFPAQDAGCAVCHRGTPSHQQASPLPPSHSPAMNCRQCHGNGQPLPHPDGGHPCTTCHR